MVQGTNTSIGKDVTMQLQAADTMSRIIDTEVYGTHIALTCKNHSDLRWSTKNIAPIGSRSLFYNLHYDPDMGPECKCPTSDLVPAKDQS